MTALPEVYRLPSIQRGFINPDFDTLEAALPPENEEPYADLRVLGERQMAISQAMPGAGMQGTFGYIYASLSKKLADGIHYRWRNGDLPELNQKEELELQAWHFSKTWTDPIRHYIDWRRAARSGDELAQRRAVKQIGPQWMYTFDTPAVQFAAPVVQFGAGGMGPHIVAGHDLQNSCINSGVSDKYMADTYPAVDKYIKLVTHEKAPELLEGNPKAVAIMASPVALGIAGLRWNTRQRFYKAKQEEDLDKREAMFDRADQQAVLLSKTVVKFGGAALGAFGLVFGTNAVHHRVRRSLVQTTDEYREAA